MGWAVSEAKLDTRLTITNSMSFMRRNENTCMFNVNRKRSEWWGKRKKESCYLLPSYVLAAAGNLYVLFARKRSWDSPKSSSTKCHLITVSIVGDQIISLSDPQGYRLTGNTAQRTAKLMFCSKMSSFLAAITPWNSLSWRANSHSDSQDITRRFTAIFTRVKETMAVMIHTPFCA
jgi:hypothetical protein